MASKKDLLEKDICAPFILPALKKVGSVGLYKNNSQIVMQVVLKEVFEK